METFTPQYPWKLRRGRFSTSIFSGNISAATIVTLLLMQQLLSATVVTGVNQQYAVGGDAAATPAQDFVCPEDFGYFPHPTDCSQYFVCVFGGALLESCTGGLLYSHDLQTCDWPRNIGQNSPCNSNVSLATPAPRRRGSSNQATPDGNQYVYKPIRIDDYGTLNAVIEQQQDQQRHQHLDDDYARRDGRSYAGLSPGANDVQLPRQRRQKRHDKTETDSNIGHHRNRRQAGMLMSLFHRLFGTSPNHNHGNQNSNQQLPPPSLASTSPQLPPPTASKLTSGKEPPTTPLLMHAMDTPSHGPNPGRQLFYPPSHYRQRQPSLPAATAPASTPQFGTITHPLLLLQQQQQNNQRLRNATTPIISHHHHHNRQQTDVDANGKPGNKKSPVTLHFYSHQQRQQQQSKQHHSSSSSHGNANANANHQRQPIVIRNFTYRATPPIVLKLPGREISNQYHGYYDNVKHRHSHDNNNVDKQSVGGGRGTPQSSAVNYDYGTTSYAGQRYAAQVPQQQSNASLYASYDDYGTVATADDDEDAYYVYEDEDDYRYYQSPPRQQYQPPPTTTTTTSTTTTARPRTRYQTVGNSKPLRHSSVVAPPRHGNAAAPSRSRPTLKPKSSIVSSVAKKSKPVRDVYVDAPSRPRPVRATPTPNAKASKCRRDTCVLPDCWCGGKPIPGGLQPEQTPQLVLLTFDDSVNDLNKQLYKDLFEKGRANPNGCPISATFYVSHEWTNYAQVQNLAANGHEIASHSVTHSFGESFSSKKWQLEINGQREILSAYAGIPLSAIRGMRAPFLSIGGNNMFKMLHDVNFTYDSSMPIYENRPPSWPYTLDYRIFHDCMIPPCPTKSYPGVWEVPMVMWQDLKGGRCSMGDACSNPATAEGVYQMLAKNFERHYTTNRAPFGLFYHAAWFTQAHHKEGFEAFLDTLTQMQDVWLVTNWQAIQWVRQPTPINRLNSFEPFNECRDQRSRPPHCAHPRVCNLWHKSGVRYLKTCQSCPAKYPWVGNTGVPFTLS